MTPWRQDETGFRFKVNYGMGAYRDEVEKKGTRLLGAVSGAFGALRRGVGGLGFGSALTLSLTGTLALSLWYRGFIIFNFANGNIVLGRIGELDDSCSAKSLGRRRRRRDRLILAL
jgi:hypothetical protein